MGSRHLPQTGGSGEGVMGGKHPKCGWYLVTPCVRLLLRWLWWLRDTRMSSVRELGGVCVTDRQQAGGTGDLETRWEEVRVPVRGSAPGTQPASRSPREEAVTTDGPRKHTGQQTEDTRAPKKKGNSRDPGKERQVREEGSRERSDNGGAGGGKGNLVRPAKSGDRGRGH